ncbi:MAG: multidrug efflux pump subunit AcrB, partial [Bacteroidia bacterium]
APMLLETSTSAQFLIPMAVSLATGIIFASVIILFLIPALVMIREDMRMKNRGTRTKQDILPNAAS